MEFFDEDPTLGFGDDDLGQDNLNVWLNTQSLPSQLGDTLQMSPYNTGPQRDSTGSLQAANASISPKSVSGNINNPNMWQQAVDPDQMSNNPGFNTGVMPQHQPQMNQHMPMQMPMMNDGQVPHNIQAPRQVRRAPNQMSGKTPGQMMPQMGQMNQMGQMPNQAQGQFNNQVPGMGPNMMPPQQIPGQYMGNNGSHMSPGPMSQPMVNSVPVQNQDLPGRPPSQISQGHPQGNMGRQTPNHMQMGPARQPVKANTANRTRASIPAQNQGHPGSMVSNGMAPPGMPPGVNSGNPMYTGRPQTAAAYGTQNPERFRNSPTAINAEVKPKRSRKPSAATLTAQAAAAAASQVNKLKTEVYEGMPPQNMKVNHPLPGTVPQEQLLQRRQSQSHAPLGPPQGAVKMQQTPMQASAPPPAGVTPVNRLPHSDNQPKEVPKWLTLRVQKLSPPEVLRDLAALSLHTQCSKIYGSPNPIREAIRRLGKFSDSDRRAMIENFEASKTYDECLVAKLPVMRIIPQIFWKMIDEVFKHLRIVPMPQYAFFAGYNVPMLSLFQKVQSSGGYVNVTLQGLWRDVMQSLGIPPNISQDENLLLSFIEIYAAHILSFEVYANRNDHARFLLTSKLASTPAQLTPATFTGQAGPTTDGDAEMGRKNEFPRAPNGLYINPDTGRPGSVTGSQTVISPLVSASPVPNISGQGTVTSSTSTSAGDSMPLDPNAVLTEVAPPPGFEHKRARSGPFEGLDAKRRSQGSTSNTVPFWTLVQDNEYLLQRRHKSTHGGRNVRYLCQLGNEIENWRPEVAFPLDLGTVDLHAVTLGLASRDPAEVRQALDKLAVVSANPRVHESLQHCPRLLANLCNLILIMLHQLLKKPQDESKDNSSSYVLRTVQSRPLKFDKSFARMIARRSTSLEPMYKVKDRVCAEHPATELEIELDDEGIEINRKERPASKIVDLENSHDMEYKDTSAIGNNHVNVDSEGNPLTANDPWVSTIPEFKPSDGPFYFPCYGTRYERVESEICTMAPVKDEKYQAFFVGLCDRLLLATCVLRNLSFSMANRVIIARKPEFQKLLWELLDIIGEHPKLLDSELRTLDLYKDILTVLGNIALYVRMPNARDTLKLILFLISFSPVESPYTSTGEIKLMDYDIDVHRYLPNAVDVFVKIAPREEPNRKLIEEVLLGTSKDPGYQELLRRWLLAQGRTEAYPAELLTRVFALSVIMMPLTHFRPPSRDIETRQPYLLQGSLALEQLVNMIPDDVSEFNIATSWLNSLENFGARLVRTLNFMGMVVVNHSDGEAQRPFAKITQRGVNVVQQLYKKAKSDPKFNSTGIVPSIETLLGGLMASRMDKSVVKHMSSLYDCSIQEKSTTS